MTSLLARPKWKIGQVLLPQHLKTLEDAPHERRGDPLEHGGATCDWPPPARVEWPRAGARDPLGEGVDGGAARRFGGGRPRQRALAAPFDLKLPGRPQVHVFAHVFTDEEAGPWTRWSQRRRRSPRRYFQVKVSIEGSMAQSHGRILLGEFAAGDDGVFRQLKKTIPPLLRLDSTPYLQDELKHVRNEIMEFESVLGETAATALREASRSWPIQRTRIDARKLVALLDDTAGGVHHHPCVVFAALRSFAVELCVLDDTGRSLATTCVRPQRSTALLRPRLRRKSRRSCALRRPSRLASPFELENGRWVVSIPADAVAAHELFIAVRKLRAVEPNPLEGVKLASLDAAAARARTRACAAFERSTWSGPRSGTRSAPPWTSVDPCARARRGARSGLRGARARARFFHEPRLDGYRFLLCWRPR